MPIPVVLNSLKFPTACFMPQNWSDLKYRWRLCRRFAFSHFFFADIWIKNIFKRHALHHFIPQRSFSLEIFHKMLTAAFLMLKLTTSFSKKRITYWTLKWGIFLFFKFISRNSLWYLFFLFQHLISQLKFSFFK